MTEKEKMLSYKMYDANNDTEILEDRRRCKLLCQKYNALPIDDLEGRDALIKQIFGQDG